MTKMVNVDWANVTGIVFLGCITIVALYLGKGEIAATCAGAIAGFIQAKSKDNK